jgi:hypothetical protein
MEVHMSKFGYSAIAAGLVGGAMLMFGTAAPASATTLSGAAISAPVELGAVHEIRHRPGHRVRTDRPRRWDRHRHGPRFRHARPGFRHFHGGFFYATPWWLGPGISLGLTVPAPRAGLPSAHVQWCMARYRTYDPATDTYFPRVGVRARCSSPYVSW